MCTKRGVLYYYWGENFLDQGPPTSSTTSAIAVPTVEPSFSQEKEKESRGQATVLTRLPTWALSLIRP